MRRVVAESSAAFAGAEERLACADPKVTGLKDNRSTTKASMAQARANQALASQSQARRSGAAGTRTLLTAEEVAEMIGMGVDWVYAESRRGRIPTVKLGRYRRYRIEAIETWLRQLEG